jgi:hypothetical protein
VHDFDALGRFDSSTKHNRDRKEEAEKYELDEETNNGCFAPFLPLIP